MQTSLPKKGGVYIGPTSVGAAFTHPETHPVTLSLLLLKEFGKEFVEWEPETLWVEIPREFGKSVSFSNKQKIQACRSILTADAAFERWSVFEAVCFGLSGEAPRFDVVSRASPPACILATDILSTLMKGKEIDDEVYKYCAACLMDTGIVYAPGSLEPCNKHLVKLLGDDKLQNAVRVLVSGDRITSLPSGSMLALQVGKSQFLKDYSAVQVRILDSQIARLCKE